MGGVNTWTLAYTVPAGHRIILKTVHVFNPGAAAHSYGVRIGTTQVVRQVSIGVNVSDDWNTWIVLNPAETIYVLQVVASTISYVVSGYLLYI